MPPETLSRAPLPSIVSCAVRAREMRNYAPTARDRAKTLPTVRLGPRGCGAARPVHDCKSKNGKGQIAVRSAFADSTKSWVTTILQVACSGSTHPFRQQQKRGKGGASSEDPMRAKVGQPSERRGGGTSVIAVQSFRWEAVINSARESEFP